MSDEQQRIDRLENQVQALKSALVMAYQQIQTLSFQLDTYQQDHVGVSLRNRCADQIQALSFIRK